MKNRIAALFLVVLLAGCASFKELEPVPPVQSGERGYIELRNDKENFLIKRDNQYFIKFPKPLDVHFYLILETSAKRKVVNYFTATFHDGQPPIVPIADQASDQDSVGVFAIDTSNTFYFWVIDTVYQDQPLNIRYRYVPQWRYIVETKYDLFRTVLATNSFDKRSYEAMGPQFDFKSFNASSEQQKLRDVNKQLVGMNDQLMKLEQVFPANIASSKDTMYQRYVGLRDDTKRELGFQSDYDEILTVLQREAATKGDFAAFMAQATEFEKILEQKDRFRAPILEYLKSVYVQRLGEALPTYEGELRAKSDLSAVELTPAMANVEGVYIACGAQVPSEIKDVRDFAFEFNALVKGVKNAESTYETVNAAMQQKSPWPENAFYPDMVSRLEKAKNAIPENRLSRFDRYHDLPIVSLITSGEKSVRSKIDQLEAQYRRASDVVQQINALRPQKDYSGMIQILRNNRDLGFVLAQYPDIDDLMLKAHAEKIRGLLANRDWKGTESSLSDLLNDKNYLNLAQIAAKKLQSVQSFESELFERIMSLTTERVDNFTKKNESTVDNIPGLYADSAFMPIYTLTFSSESQARVSEKRRKIDTYINQAKTIRFPENSIKTIYKALTQAPHDRGVEKARAILAHAKFYKGTDKSVRNIIDECDPLIAKPLLKAKDYRRLLVLPVNESPSTSNEYVFRVNVKVPSDAEFPVFDVNIKVPPEIAERVKEKQWFTEMTLNRKVVKTEGHMRITAPSSANDYEAQITPVQMSKSKDNVIEIRFKYPSFQLFEVSVMAQVPLIRKN
jgi:hypothetical protein